MIINFFKKIYKFIVDLIVEPDFTNKPINDESSNYIQMSDAIDDKDIEYNNKPFLTKSEKKFYTTLLRLEYIENYKVHQNLF